VQSDGLAEAGPWWERAALQVLQRTPQEQAELHGLERLLAGLRRPDSSQNCSPRALLGS
jgi:hypothetical protein